MSVKSRQVLAVLTACALVVAVMAAAELRYGVIWRRKSGTSSSPSSIRGWGSC
jgi:type II secretory pathway component PulK